MVNGSTFLHDSANFRMCNSLTIGHPLAMLTRIYIEALLVDEELADQVWEAWDEGEVDNQVALLAWWLITNLTDVSIA